MDKKFPFHPETEIIFDIRIQIRKKKSIGFPEFFTNGKYKRSLRRRSTIFTYIICTSNLHSNRKYILPVNVVNKKKFKDL